MDLVNIDRKNVQKSQKNDRRSQRTSLVLVLWAQVLVILLVPSLTASRLIPSHYFLSSLQGYLAYMRKQHNIWIKYDTYTCTQDA